MNCIKALGSRLNFDDEHELIEAYNSCVSELMEHELVQKLANMAHHVDINRLQHSVNVSYYSFYAAEKLGLDSSACARAGLMHDLFFYECRGDGRSTNHTYVHPKQALDNAKTICELSKKEEEIILNHMWPGCLKTPRFAETYLVSIIDKYCASLEAADFVVRRLKRRVKYFGRGV